jgi:hypothetical protein
VSAKPKWRTLKTSDARPEGYEFRRKDRKNWHPAIASQIGRVILRGDAEHYDYRAPVAPRPRKRAKKPGVAFHRSATRGYLRNALKHAEVLKNKPLTAAIRRALKCAEKGKR